MFKTIKDKIKRDSDYPQRQYDIDVLTRVIDGVLYDVLQYDFHTEKKDQIDEYIPLRDRRPSVRYALCRIVVDDSVSLLFSEGHFPSVQCEDEETAEGLAKVIKDSKLNEVMIEAATRGSVGSVAILMRVLSKRVFFEAMNTQFLTPKWKRDEPDTLESVTEKYKVKGHVLADMGYLIAESDQPLDFWFQRQWTADSETWFTPWKCKSSETPVEDVAQVDSANTVKHGLGFVPMVWVKNLPGGDKIDGKPTFSSEVIDTQIEIDYQLSQGGRALKYAGDPTLMIKEPAVDTEGRMVKGGANALVVSSEGDAKLLEISGGATEAVVNYVKFLRELALESAHGNRSSADKLSAAQSGRAMELMHQSLLWLADKLRISYGEGALLSLLKMVVKARAKFDLVIDGQEIPELDQSKPIALRWPNWFAPTYADKQTEAITLTTLREGGLLSRETAVNSVADSYDIEDAAEEIKRIEADPPASAAAQESKINPESDD